MKPSFVFFLATLVGECCVREEEAASTTYVASLNANANLRGVSVGASEERSPFIVPADTYAAANLTAVTGMLSSLLVAIVTMFFPYQYSRSPPCPPVE